ncbi:hypothetical protein [Kitasatospora sp. GP82]|uniref:hypothetical protein n=1 Tax=Kitasatospora sp. GP82 TaxID=3035089 RepID=UPI002473AAA6|nr:hypothetical protein [Kitasatospora sp. GP82]MDH6127418.1 hypothetical protein [Kitasatospora sp. GP82]
MRTVVGRQEEAIAAEFEGLSLGVDSDELLPEFLGELLLGRPDESDATRAARLDAARGILADLDAEPPELAAYAAALLEAVPLARRALLRHPVRTEATA